MSTDTIQSVKERPILFSTPMVRAILEGRKTVTRRIVDMPKENIQEAQWGYTCFTPDNHISFRAKHDNGNYVESFVKLKYGKRGEVLWVRETWALMDLYDKDSVVYKADFIERYGGWERDTNEGIERIETWKPSIHMLKSACRLKLEILSITVERLHDITEEDAIREGIEKFDGFVPEHWVAQYKNYLRPGTCSAPIQSFESLWQSINGEESWQSNPWVWVINFKKL